MRRAPHSHAQERFGAYVRSQRQLARLSLRQAAAIARISNPYLSQIEHGLALPSVSVIRALADTLHVSADHLLLLAAGISAGDDPSEGTSTEDAIRQDSRLDEAQKHALLAVLASFLTAEAPSGSPNGSTAASPSAGPTASPPAGAAAPTTPTPVDDGAAAAPSTPPRQRQKPKARAQKRKPHGNP